MNESRFDGKGGIYAKFRPSYPIEFIDYLYHNVGIHKSSIIADIGSGTGILTKLLLGKGNNVFAVEPNDDMRAAAELELSNLGGFTSINGSDVNTTLVDGSVDFITVAQAFHWFDTARFKTECSRILKPNGKVILVWNIRILDAQWVKDSDEINRKYCPDYKGFNGGMRGIEDKNRFDVFFTGEYETIVFQNDHTFDLGGFIGRSLSSSYALKENDEKYSLYIGELADCFHKHSVDGKLNMPNVTRSYAGTV